MERWINQSQKYEGEVFSVWGGEARLDDGTIVKRDVVRHSGSVTIVPVVGSSVLLVRQFRISIGREILELPAGRLHTGEDIESAARRELEEEVGHVAERFIHVSTHYSSVGYSDERVHIVIAQGLSETARRPEPDERITVVPMPIDVVKQQLARHEFDDSKTIIGLMALIAYLEARSETEANGRQTDGQ